MSSFLESLVPLLIQTLLSHLAPDLCHHVLPLLTSILKNSSHHTSWRKIPQTLINLIATFSAFVSSLIFQEKNHTVLKVGPPETYLSNLGEAPAVPWQHYCVFPGQQALLPCSIQDNTYDSQKDTLSLPSCPTYQPLILSSISLEKQVIRQ